MDDEQLPIVEAVSAGGVVFRLNGHDVDVAIVKILPEMHWQLPKGLIDPGETTEAAALREVREEAGLEAALVGPLDKIDYWFTADYDGARKRYHKFVHFFLMKYVAGSVNDHDHEVSEARWVTADDALSMLAFENERHIVEKAIRVIRNGDHG